MSKGYVISAFFLGTLLGAMLVAMAEPFVAAFWINGFVNVSLPDPQMQTVDIRSKNVAIITNDQGNRTTPSSVTVAETERTIGEAAKNQVADPKNTVFDAKPPTYT